MRHPNASVVPARGMEREMERKNRRNADESKGGRRRRRTGDEEVEQAQEKEVPKVEHRARERVERQAQSPVHNAVRQQPEGAPPAREERAPMPPVCNTSAPVNSNSQRSTISPKDSPPSLARGHGRQAADPPRRRIRADTRGKDGRGGRWFGERTCSPPRRG